MGIGSILILLVASETYVQIMYRGTHSPDSVVDGLNFSVQTLTTVGYGNWKPAGVADDDARVFWVKAISIPTMVVGAFLFSLTVAVIVELFKL